MINNIVKRDVTFLMCDGQGGWGSRMPSGRPRKERPYVDICLEPAHPVTVFSLMLMLHRNGVWTPANRQEHPAHNELLSAFRKEVLEPRGLSDDDEVWALVQDLNVNREQADQAAAKQLPGYAFYWNYNDKVMNSLHGVCRPARKLCVEPALALSVMARLSGGFYHADRSPDYTIGNLCEKGAAFSDLRLSGEAMYPLWKLKQK